MLNQLKVQRLGKKIGFKTILSEINFAAEKGELLVVTGPNGAGKTTLLRMLAGLTQKSGGEIWWDGERFSTRKAQLLRRIGFLGHRPMVYESLTAFENLAFFAKMYGVFTEERVNELLRKVELNGFKHENVAHFSRGMQQRLAIARMLLHEPDLCLYDEPFTGLDGAGQKFLANTLGEMQRAGKVQILISHNLEEVKGVHFREIKLAKGMMVEE